MSFIDAKTSSSLPEEVERNNGFMSRFRFIKQTRVNRLDIFLLASTAILSGQISAWNTALSNGFGVLMWACVTNTVGYVILTCCIAEMTSALPFSGGIYGFVRAFTLPVLGFMVAVFELMMNLFYVSPVVYTLASLPFKIGIMSEKMILFACFLVYVFILIILLIGGKVFWIVTKSLGAMTVVMFLTYIIGSCTYADFDTWGRGKHGEAFSGIEFMKQIPLVSTLYIGIQLIPLTARCAPDPKKDVPTMMNFSMIVFAFMTFGLITTAVSQYPGIDLLSDRATPLTFGFSRIFHLNFERARWISAPFLFATAFAFIFFCGRQASCMAKSGLIPEVFNRVIPVLDTPYVSLLTFAGLSFLLNIVIYYNEDLIRNFYLVTALSSFIVYIAALVGYIRFHHKYSSLERYFKSPFGVWGAYIGIMIFGCCFIGGALFQYDRFVSIGIILVTGLLAFLYFLFLSGEHVFSEEEKQELFKAYLVNANLATKKRIQQRMRITNPSITPAAKQSTSTPTSQTISVTASRHSVKPLISKSSDDKKDIENAVQLSPPDLSSEEPMVISEKVVRKSLSQSVISFFSSKFNQILPEDNEDKAEIERLDILQGDRGFSIEVKETPDSPNNVENLEM